MKNLSFTRSQERGAAVRGAVSALIALGCTGANAFTFSNDTIQGSLDSTVSAGVGVRTASQSENLVSPTYDPATGARTGGGSLGQISGLSDQGNINYNKGNAFTTYLKGSHELLLKMPTEGLAVMARGSWVYDYAGTRTTGATSGQDALAASPPDISGGLASDARSNVRFKARLLDLWVSKQFSVGDQQARVRVGNQVISWGESIFEIGGVNATNAIDINRASQPGAQVKEFVLPAPIVSVASGLGHGVNVEGYVQSNWNKSYLPPVGSYWSTSTTGAGQSAYGVREARPKNGGQFGFAARYQPDGTDINLGVYAIAYHDNHLDDGGLEASLRRHAGRHVPALCVAQQRPVFMDAEFLRQRNHRGRVPGRSTHPGHGHPGPPGCNGHRRYLSVDGAGGLCRQSGLARPNQCHGDGRPERGERQR